MTDENSQLSGSVACLSAVFFSLGDLVNISDSWGSTSKLAVVKTDMVKIIIFPLR